VGNSPRDVSGDGGDRRIAYDDGAPCSSFSGNMGSR
jgi:hypothetical protein